MPALRLLPLLSSATEMVHALGLGDFQVGRSHECDYPPSVLDLPICTKPAIAVSGSSSEIDRLVRERVASALSVYEVDSDLIRELRPTHILTQTQCKVCAVSLDEVEAALKQLVGIPLQVVSVEPYALEDVWHDIARIAVACGRVEEGRTLVHSLNHRMREIASQARTAGERPTVACLEWLEPLMAAGNWIPELVELAQAETPFGIAGQHSPWMTFEDLVRVDPKVIVAMPCGFDLERTRAEMHWLADRPEWSKLRAVIDGRVYVTDGNQFLNRPGPRLVESLRLLAEVLHPQLFEPSLEHIGWERL